MKTLKCDICEFETQGATFEEWVNILKPHYGQAHMDIMQSKAHLSDEQKIEQKMAEMQKWMSDNKARFEAQSENN